jgi:NAD(P)-dependent dehydrogenase (short-subunit alcohol dehydrogenase family)
MCEFEGKTALVTGAGQGMGKAVAVKLFTGGANIIVSDINRSAIEAVVRELEEIASVSRGACGRVVAVAVDVRRPDEVNAFVQTAVDTFGTADILINNAGVLRPTAVEDITEDEWDLLMDVNAKGVFLCMQAVLPHMRKNNYGRIVNMSSSAGRSTSTLGGIHYTASKAAVLGLTRHCAREYGAHGITANAVCPGLIDTEMVQKEVSPERLQRYLGSFPIHRLGTPEEVADMVVFLASDRAAYITGATVDINGGDLMM